MQLKGGKRASAKERGYDSRWGKVRKLKLRADPLCEECNKGHVLTRAVMVHHIVPIEDGGEPLDWGNLMSLCTTCHDKKHSKGSIGNVGGCGADGMPLHSLHPWVKK
mgnify:CR=1 FL=1